MPLHDIKLHISLETLYLHTALALTALLAPNPSRSSIYYPVCVCVCMCVFYENSKIQCLTLSLIFVLMMLIHVDSLITLLYIGASSSRTGREKIDAFL